MYRVWYWLAENLHMVNCGSNVKYAVKLWIYYVQAGYNAPAYNAWLEYIAIRREN